MSEQQADLAQLRNELDAFIHIIEVLAKCRRHTQVKIDPEALQRLARVFNQHIAIAIEKIYGT